MGDKPGGQFICDFQTVGGATTDEETTMGFVGVGLGFLSRKA